jgi:hypothetical protein
MARATSILTVSFENCQQRLARLWFVWSGIIVGIVFLQTIFGHFEGRLADTWKWVAASLGPPLALLAGAVVAKRLSQQRRRGKTLVSRFAYRLSAGVSSFYLLLLTLTILLEPIAMMATQRADLNLIKTSELWLIPMQSLLTGSLGAFGASKVEDS